MNSTLIKNPQTKIAGTANTAANQVAFGNRVLSQVAPGVAGTDAVNVNQLNGAVAGITADITALESDVAVLEGDVGTLFNLRRRDRREARRGTAAAVAMSEAPMPSRDGGISYSLHGSAYRGEYGIGGSLKYRISSGFAVDVGVSHAGSNDTAGRIGVSGEF